MLNSGEKKFATKKINILTRVVRKNILSETKKHNPKLNGRPFMKYKGKSELL